MVTTNFVLKEEQGQLGGPGTIIQIDESKFGKRKFNRGRRVEGHWVLGAIQNGSEDFRLIVCPDNIRNAETSIPIIKQHIRVVVRYIHMLGKRIDSCHLMDIPTK